MTPPTPPAGDSPSQPEGAGTESVVDLHRRHMAELNEAAMSADGTPPHESEEPDAVRNLLDMLAREQAEPRDGFEPVPFWVACIFGALLAWGGYYMGTNNADFRRDVFDRADLTMPESAPPAPEPDPQTVDELMKVGQQQYQAICSTCHLPGGEGKPAEGIPPLKGSEWVVGDQASAERLSRILLYGMKDPVTVKGRTFNAVMPNRGNTFKDYQIAGVLTYIRNNKEWGHEADKDKPPAITASVVRAARAKGFAGKEEPRKVDGTQPVTAAELMKEFPITSAKTPKDETKK
ncbi:MAG TPA: cytochrome c [Gemmata sp.]|nr:cytochrome c [Gemmata sp.]